MTKEELCQKWCPHLDDMDPLIKMNFFEDLDEWYLDEQNIALDRVKEELIKQIKAMDEPAKEFHTEAECSDECFDPTEKRRIFDCYD